MTKSSAIQIYHVYSIALFLCSAFLLSVPTLFFLHSTATFASLTNYSAALGGLHFLVQLLVQFLLKWTIDAEGADGGLHGT